MNLLMPNSYEYQNMFHNIIKAIKAFKLTIIKRKYLKVITFPTYQDLVKLKASFLILHTFMVIITSLVIHKLIPNLIIASYFINFITMLHVKLNLHLHNYRNFIYSLNLIILMTKLLYIMIYLLIHIITIALVIPLISFF